MPETQQRVEPKVQRLGYLALRVTDLDEAIDFYARFARLDLTEQIGDVAFMSGGLEHHWVRLELGDTDGFARLGYEIADEATLDALVEEIGRRGITVEEGGDFATERVRRWARFADPSGFPLELYVDMAQQPMPPPSTGVTFDRPLHGGWTASDFDASAAFYQEVLGFAPSDWLGETVGFFRCANGFHHSLVLVRSPVGVTKFDHLCIQVESIDDVMRVRHNAVQHGIELRSDLLRHPTSNSVSVYFRDVKRDLSIEICTGHMRITDPDHRPRRLPVSAETADVWKIPLPEPNLRRVGGRGDQPTALPSLRSVGD